LHSNVRGPACQHGVVWLLGAIPEGVTVVAVFMHWPQAQDCRYEDQASVIAILAARQGAMEADEVDFLDRTQEKIRVQNPEHERRRCLGLKTATLARKSRAPASE
jgi:hypothetical protein